jgi:hypothetical protein
MCIYLHAHTKRRGRQRVNARSEMVDALIEVTMSDGSLNRAGSAREVQVLERQECAPSFASFLSHTK